MNDAESGPTSLSASDRSFSSRVSLLDIGRSTCSLAPPASAIVPAVVFVAPRDGNYRFATEGLAELSSSMTCDPGFCAPADSSRNLFIERNLYAGEQLVLRFLAFPRVGTISIAMTRTDL